MVGFVSWFIVIVSLRCVIYPRTLKHLTCCQFRMTCIQQTKPNKHTMCILLSLKKVTTNSTCNIQLHVILILQNLNDFTIFNTGEATVSHKMIAKLNVRKRYCHLSLHDNSGAGNARLVPAPCVSHTQGLVQLTQSYLDT